MTLDEFKAELSGFGFSDDRLGRYINWGGRFVANRTRPYWEEFTWQVDLTAGQGTVDLSTLTGYKAVDHVYVTTDGYEKKLRVANWERFYNQWAAADLANSSNWSEPTEYYIWNQKLWILPPTASQRSIDIHGHRRWVMLVQGSDTPVTPPEFDEAIILSAQIRCHRRASETDLEQNARVELDEFFDIIADEEEMLKGEEVDRIGADDSWY